MKLRYARLCMIENETLSIILENIFHYILIQDYIFYGTTLYLTFSEFYLIQNGLNVLDRPEASISCRGMII